MVICGVTARRQFNRTLDSFSSLALNTGPFEGSANSHGIKSFADPHLLTLLESRLFKKSGGGLLQIPSTSAVSRPFLAISFLFTLLRTLWHAPKLNSFLFNRFGTLCPKTPGVGVHPSSQKPISLWPYLRIASLPPYFITSCVALGASGSRASGRRWRWSSRRGE